jgi:hypothetical protein
LLTQKEPIGCPWNEKENVVNWSASALKGRVAAGKEQAKPVPSSTVQAVLGILMRKMQLGG